MLKRLENYRIPALVKPGTRVVNPRHISERAKLVSDENTLQRLAPDWGGHAQEQ